MDEATSSLDSQSESFVQATIQNLKKQGKTILLIAHRLSTVLDADQIVVISEGKLIEQGTHSELYCQEGLYSQMWQKQLPSSVKKFITQAS